MSSHLSTAQNVRQGLRQQMVKTSDKFKLASSAVTRGDNRDLEVAIIKSTTPQFHVVPKEKHIRTLKSHVQGGGKDSVRDVIKQLIHRLKAATDWLTALKTLMVIHRLIRECDASFLNAMVQYSNNVSSANSRGGGSLLCMNNFLDTTNIEGRFDYSEWVRAYGNYIDEQLEIYRELNFYPEMEHGGESSKMRNLSGPELLKQLPVLQRLQLRLMDCKPSGVAAHDSVVQAALMAVLKESFKVYKAISEGIINLADRFFEMDYLDAQKGLEIYKESIVGNTRLQEYYKQVESIEELKRAVQFPKLENLPSDFLTQMEGYVKEAPRKVDDTTKEIAVRKKTVPLRRGTRASKGARTEPIPSDNSPGDPGMIQSLSKEEAPKEAVQEEPNLLDLEDLTISEPSPATQTSPDSVPNGFGSNHLSPAAAGNDPFAPINSPPLSNNNSMATNSFSPAPYTQPSNGFGGYSAPTQPQGNPFGGGNNSFSPMPATSPFAQTHGSAAPQIQANPPASMQSYISAAPQLGANQPNSSQNPQTIGSAAPQGIASLPVNGQLYPSGGMQFQSGQPPAGSQSFNPSYPAARGTPMAGGLAGATSPYSQAPGTQGFNYMPAAPSSFNQNSLSGYQSQAPSMGLSQAGTLQWSPVDEFGSDVRRPTQATPSKPAATAAAVGLTRPTNVALAKEAALHDPFASLAFTRPTGPVKSSPPLKNMSPGSASGSQQSSHTSPGPAPTNTSQTPTYKFPDNGGFASDLNGFGSSAFQQPPQPIQQASSQQAPPSSQPAVQQPVQPSSLSSEDPFSLI